MKNIPRLRGMFFEKDVLCIHRVLKSPIAGYHIQEVCNVGGVQLRDIVGLDKPCNVGNIPRYWHGRHGGVKLVVDVYVQHTNAGVADDSSLAAIPSTTREAQVMSILFKVRGFTFAHVITPFKLIV